MANAGSILVIDDEEIMREILEALLVREGYDVRLAADGAEGLELARAGSFDAAVVDVMMPGMDGIATLDELKKIDDELPVLGHHRPQPADAAGVRPDHPGGAQPVDDPDYG